MCCNEQYSSNGVPAGPTSIITFNDMPKQKVSQALHLKLLQKQRDGTDLLHTYLAREQPLHAVVLSSVYSLNSGC